MATERDACARWLLFSRKFSSRCGRCVHCALSQASPCRCPVNRNMDRPAMFLCQYNREAFDKETGVQGHGLVDSRSPLPRCSDSFRPRRLWTVDLAGLVLGCGNASGSLVSEKRVPAGASEYVRAPRRESGR